MFNRQKIGVISAEFFGTAMLALVASGAAQYFNFTAPWYIGVAVAVALATIVGTIGKVSGAHVNPAITVGLWTLRKIPTIDAVVYIAAQVLGGATALAFFEYVRNTEVASAQITNFDGRVFVAEMVGTAVFAFGVASVVLQKMESMQAAFTIGASLMLGVLIGALAAPAYLNPAVALSFNAFDSTSVFAPLIGAVVGMNIYSFVVAPGMVVAKKSR